MQQHPRGIFEKAHGSGVWWVRYADAQGRERREKAGTKGMAMQLYRRRKTEAAQGRKLPENLRARPVTFQEITIAGIEWSKANKASWRQDCVRFAQINRLIGSRPAHEITPQELERALRKLMEDRGWAPATFNRVKSIISMAYRLAVQNGVVNSNPARLVRQMRVDNGRIRFLSPAEEMRLRQAIMEDCPQHLPAFEIAVNTGLRASEQFHLTWEDVDLERRQICLTQTKNGRVRYIPLNPTATKAFAAMRQTHDGDGKVFLNTVTKSRYQGQARTTARNWFEAVCRKAQLQDFTWHCLRHTFASRLVMSGVDIRTVAELMGHRTLAMTMRYAHLAPQHQQDAVERLERFHPKPTGTKTGTGVSDAQAESNQVVSIQ